MYTNVRDEEPKVASDASLSGLLNHTALAGHAILVGGGHQLQRIAPILRQDRMVVTDVRHLSDADPFMFVSRKTMIVVNVHNDEQRRFFSNLAHTYPNILLVGIASDETEAHELDENRCLVGPELGEIGESILSAWRAWQGTSETQLEAWLECLEHLVPCYASSALGDEDLSMIGGMLGLEEVHVLGTDSDQSWTKEANQGRRAFSVRAPAYSITTPMVLSEQSMRRYLSSERSLGMKTALLMPIETSQEKRGFLLAIGPKGLSWDASACSRLSVVGQARAYQDSNPDGEGLDVIVELLVHILSGKDGYTAQHSDRVAILAREIALELDLSASSVQLSYLGGRLHDIGKLWVDDHFLTKAGPLTPAEYEALKTHTTAGYDLLDRFERLRILKHVVLCHHERMDGFGYPQGLSGDAIPFLARIVSVADAYDAMTTDRSYRRGRPSAEALEELNRCAGKQFDAQIVTAFNRVFKRLETPTFQHSL